MNFSDQGVLSEAIKEWLRENLEINVRLSNPLGPENSVEVGLRFQGEKDNFSEVYINIPHN